ncbi:MAG: polymerase subunit beta [Actinomycetota bacterium]|nr:polymerase subunit beta [Actinomycetota bacterium]MDQ1671033.1 polymerase subunit beta [Actinomycetota bacterium]
MKFRVERDVLADAVAWAARGLPARPPVPVLAGLMLDASDASAPGGLVLSSFDYEVSARVEISADISEPGVALVSGRLLADISRSLPDRPVEVTTDASKVVLTCGTSRFTLLTLPVEDYPALPTMPGASGSLRGDAFAAAVAQVSVAAGRDDTLPVLTGVRLEIEGEKITMAATDRYRLAVRDLGWTPEQTGLAAVALVPARTLSETAKALSGADKVTVALASSGAAGEGLVGFEGSGRRTTSRLLDGEFPKYRSLLPSESQSVATVETAALVESVRRVALVAERNTPIRLSFSGSEVTLEAGTGDEAQASESLDAGLTGDDISIAFNPNYLLDGLGALGASYAELRFTASTRPAVLAGKDSADAVAGDDYRYLLMPVRLSG